MEKTEQEEVAYDEAHLLKMLRDVNAEAFR